MHCLNCQLVRQPVSSIVVWAPKYVEHYMLGRTGPNWGDSFHYQKNLARIGWFIGAVVYVLLLKNTENFKIVELILP